VLTPQILDELQKEYNSRTGREVLLEVAEDHDDASNPKTDVALGLEKGMKHYIETFYSSRSVKCKTGIGREAENEYSILLFAERINFQQFHTGSWTARYSVKYDPKNNNSNLVRISGKMCLHAHTFENGNSQLKSTVVLPEVQTTSSRIFQQIERWDEETVMSLNNVYDGMSVNILKKLRRTIPVTRMRFDWNLIGQRGMRELGAEVQNRE